MIYIFLNVFYDPHRTFAALLPLHQDWLCPGSACLALLHPTWKSLHSMRDVPISPEWQCHPRQSSLSNCVGFNPMPYPSAILVLRRPPARALQRSAHSVGFPGVPWSGPMANLNNFNRSQGYKGLVWIFLPRAYCRPTPPTTPQPRYKVDPLKTSLRPPQHHFLMPPIVITKSKAG